MKIPVKTPLWKTWVVAIRESTNSRVQLLFTGTAYETILDVGHERRASRGLKRNGFKIHVIRDEIIGHIEQNHV